MSLAAGSPTREDCRERMRMTPHLIPIHALGVMFVVATAWLALVGALIGLAVTVPLISGFDTGSAAANQYGEY